MDLIHSIHPDLTTGYLILFLAASLVLGMAKAGLAGFGLASVPVMALIFGAKESTGVLLPMLITADIIAVIYYHSHAVWKYILAVLLWAGIGVFAAVITGGIIDDSQFRFLLVTIVWIMLALMIFNDIRKKAADNIPDNRFFSIIMGFAGGFATMIGNAAGPVFTLYFLSKRLPKNEFIGTSAWLFAILNIGKLPLQIFVWENITKQTLLPVLISLPFIGFGLFLGITIVKLFREEVYRYFVIITTIATSVLLFL